MRDSILEEQVNKYLLTFGSELDGRPRFRVVWAPAMLETREGDFAIELDGLSLGTMHAVREVPKYNYLPECFVIEELILGVIVKELPGSINGTYEPLYVFASAAGIPLPLSMNVVSIVMNAKMNPRSKVQIYHDIKDANKLKKKKIFQQDYDSIDCSVMQTRLHHGESNYTKGVRNR